MELKTAQMQLAEMERTEFDDWQQLAAAKLDVPLRRLALALIGCGEDEGKTKDKIDILQELHTMNADDRVLLVRTLAPGISKTLLQAWEFFSLRPIRSRAGLLGIDSHSKSRAAWLRDMIRLVGEFRQDVVTCHWLAVWGGWLDVTKESSSIEGSPRRLLESRSDITENIGRLLGFVIRDTERGVSTNATDKKEMEDIYGTLSLIAQRQHPVGHFGPHVALALACSGRQDAKELLINLVSFSFSQIESGLSYRDVSNDMTTCITAVAEGMDGQPNDVSDFVLALLRSSRNGAKLPWDLIDAMLVPLPENSSDEEKCEILDYVVGLLRNPLLRQRAIAGSDLLKVVTGLSVEALIDQRIAIRFASEKLLEKGKWKTKSLIATLASRWNHADVMQLWHRLLETCVSPETPGSMLVQVLSTYATIQRQPDCPPRDSSTSALLLEIGQRIILDAWLPNDESTESSETQLLIMQNLAEAIMIHRGSYSVDRLIPLIELLVRVPNLLASLIPKLTLTNDLRNRLIELVVAGRHTTALKAILLNLTGYELLASWPSKNPEDIAYYWRAASSQNSERKMIWKKLLSDSKKKVRADGLKSISEALEGRNISRDTKSDAYSALLEYQNSQSKKQRPDPEAKYTVPYLLETCQPEHLVDAATVELNRRKEYALSLITQRSGIEPSLFNLTPPTEPVDRNVTDADLVTPAARQCLKALHEFVASQPFDKDVIDQLKRFTDDPPMAELWNDWCESLPKAICEPDGSHWQRLFSSNYSHGIQYAPWWNDLTSEQQERLMSVALPESERVSEKLSGYIGNLARYFKRQIKSTLATEVLAEQMLSVVETMYARIPTNARKVAFKTPRYCPGELRTTVGIKSTLDAVETMLVSLPAEIAASLRQRHGNLMLWINVNSKDGHSPPSELMLPAVAMGAISIGDFVSFLVDSGSGYGGLSLKKLHECAEWWKVGIDTDRELQLKIAVDTLELIIREQEDEPDDQLPKQFVSWYSELPPLPRDRDLVSLMRRNSQIELTEIHKRDSREKLFIKRLQEVDPYDCRKDLMQMRDEGLLSDDRALRLAMIHPGLVKPIAQFLNWQTLPEAFVWAWAHAGLPGRVLATALGYEGEDEEGWLTLLALHAPDIQGVNRWELDFAEMATIRRDWFEKIFGEWESARRETFFNTFRAVFDADNVRSLDTILSALMGTTDRNKLVAVIELGRDCKELLEFALLPIADGANRQTDIADRIAVIDRLAIVGKKAKSSEARSRIARSIKQARRTLANNAGLADVSQLR